jgi:thiol:disulfide interchange protein DsbD
MIQRSFGKSIRLMLLLMTWSGFAQPGYGAPASTLPDPSALPPEMADTGQVQARLLASVAAVYPGARIWVGLNQKISPHWHTYWKNPGDSGLATRIAWHLPSGVEAGDIEWPVPELFRMETVTSFVYSGEVTLLTAIEIPADLPVQGCLPLAATVKWLVCEETCIPQTVELGLDLPVVADATQAGPGPGNGLIQAAQARLPLKSPWKVAFETDGAESLLLHAHPLESGSITGVHFFPGQWGSVSHGAEQPWQIQSGELTLKLRPGEAPVPADGTLTGVLVVTETGTGVPASRGYEVSATGILPLPAAPDVDSPGIALALLLALLGGLILNLMPCVFPVLSLKALHLLRHSGENPGETRRHGQVYTLGVLASFALLAALLSVLKVGGTAVGWGFQFQSPLFVLIVAYVMFTAGLSLSGVFTLGSSVVGLGSSLAARQGHAGSFYTGVLASVVATPCTAPFMGVAVGFAIAQSPAVLLGVLLSLGLGLAMPILLLTHCSALHRCLPRPGAWMNTFKQVLAFPMYATAIWLVWVLAQQTGIDQVPVALGGMLAIALGVWIHEHSRLASDPVRLIGSGTAVATVVAALLSGYSSLASTPVNADAHNNLQADSLPWETYSEERLQALRNSGRAVFIDFTAAWCISCLVNERVALDSERVKAAFRKAGVACLKGDWTNHAPTVTAKLAEFGRSGVPLYVFYPAEGSRNPVILPQILTPDLVLSALQPLAVSVSSPPSPPSL